MADMVKLFRRLADELEQEEKGEQTAAQEKARDERIDQLEKQIAHASSSERDEAVEEITDEEWDLIRHHRSSPQPEPEPEPDEEEEKPKMRRGRKRGRVYQDRKGEAGYVYQGDDEPDLVPVDAEVAV